jgi:hypothetical protein
MIYVSLPQNVISRFFQQSQRLIEVIIFSYPWISPILKRYGNILN